MAKTEKIEEKTRRKSAWATVPMWTAGEVNCFGDGTVDGLISTPEGDIRLRRAKGPVAVSPLRAIGQIKKLTCGNLWQWFADYFGGYEAVMIFANAKGGPLPQPPQSGTIYLPFPDEEITPEIEKSIKEGKCTLNWGYDWDCFLSPRAYVAVWEAARIIFNGQLPHESRINELEEIKAAIEIKRKPGHETKEDHEARLAQRLFYLGDARDYEKLGRSLKAGIEYKAPEGAPLQMMDISELQGMENFELARYDVEWIEASTRLVEEGELLPDVTALDQYAKGGKSKFPIMYQERGWPGYQVQRREDGQISPDAKPSTTRKYCIRVSNYFAPKGTVNLKKRTAFPLLWLTLNELFEEMEAVGSSKPHNHCFRCSEPTKPGKPTCGEDVCRQMYRYYTDPEYRRKKQGYGTE